jgi:hypothetical protein
MADASTPGSLMHFEFYSTQPDATRRFYERAFGWRFVPRPEAGYTMMHPPGPPNGGLLARPSGAELPAVLTYVAVADADAAARSVADAGGKVLRRYEIPGVGRFCMFEAPGGIVQVAWQQG